MRYLFSALFFLHVYSFTYSQEKPDTTLILSGVTIKAYEQNRDLLQVPAAVVTISKKELGRYNNSSILPAMNNKPGVKMEERSPGSYRLNIRGSSLRSPFGVRNVKVYYDEIPYTDPGGNTYLNQLGFYNIQDIEVIKGPGSSIYGAGTGGVLLLKTEQHNWEPGILFNYNAGSFAFNNLNVTLRLGKEAFQNTFNYLQFSSSGYRDHTKLDRKVFTWDSESKVSGKGSIKTHLIFGDLFYQTPGALTLNEFLLNPKASRPKTGPTPGAIENKAAIYNKVFMTGFTFKQIFNDHWQSITSFYGAFTKQTNPSFRNYGRNSEPHTGGRSYFKYDKNIKEKTTISLVSGVEFQQGYTSAKVYANKNGNPDTLQTDDEITNQVVSFFSQATITLPKGIIITGGLSINSQHFSIIRFTTIPAIEQSRRYNNVLAPRLAILKQLDKKISVYISAAKGFSPPGTNETVPSTGIINTSLNAEKGTSYEAGVRGFIMNGKLHFDISAFLFNLKNTIVQRRDATGADFFINAGSTRQRGLESAASWFITRKPNNFITELKLWASHTWYNFSYKEFKQLAADFSGKKLPGIGPHTVTAGIDLETKAGLYAYINYNYSDAIPLNDGNTSYASSYNLLGAKTGWKKNLHPKVLLELYATVENIFNTSYSLGNDINGFGGRYYNAAPGINFSGGIGLHFIFGE